MALYALIQSPWACCVVDCPKTGKSNCRPVTGDVLLPLRYLPTHMCHAHRKRNAVLCVGAEAVGVLCGGLPQERQERLSTCEGRSSPAVTVPPHPHVSRTSTAERQANRRPRRTFVRFQRATIQRVPTLLCDCMRAFDRVVKVASVASGKDR